MKQSDGKIALVIGGRSCGRGLVIVRATCWSSRLALRTIRVDLGASVEQLAWTVNNYSHQELDAHHRIATRPINRLSNRARRALLMLGRAAALAYSITIQRRMP